MPGQAETLDRLDMMGPCMESHYGGHPLDVAPCSRQMPGLIKGFLRTSLCPGSRAHLLGDGKYAGSWKKEVLHMGRHDIATGATIDLYVEKHHVHHNVHLPIMFGIYR